MATLDGDNESTHVVFQRAKTTRNVWMSVTYGRIPRRQWGVRFDYVGVGYLLSISVSRKPAFRIVLLGCSFWVGKIPERVKEVEAFSESVPLCGE